MGTSLGEIGAELSDISIELSSLIRRKAAHPTTEDITEEDLGSVLSKVVRLIEIDGRIQLKSSRQTTTIEWECPACEKINSHTIPSSSDDDEAYLDTCQFCGLKVELD